jgi:perosamine synthetase
MARGRWNYFKKAGSFGEAGVFAFYPNKQITTGEGGMIVTDSRKMYDLCRSLRNQGRLDGGGWLSHVRLGYNYRISDINCALGASQLERIDEILHKRRAVARQYTERLDGVAGIITPFQAPNVTIGWFVYVVQLSGDFNRKQRDLILQQLKNKGIESGVYFPPIHLQPFYRKMFGYKRGDFPVTEFVGDRTIALPFHNNLQEAEIDFVVDSLRSALREVKSKKSVR